MNLIKREPRSAWPLETMWSQDLVDTVFGDMFRSFFGADTIFDRVVDGGAHMMRLEEFIDGDTCVIRAELPGIDPDKDVDIEVADGVLHLSAQRQERTEDDRPDGYRSEFRYGRVTRHIKLPEGTTVGEVSATYKDGILEVRVPAPHEVGAGEAAKIPVTRE